MAKLLVEPLSFTVQWEHTTSNNNVAQAATIEVLFSASYLRMLQLSTSFTDMGVGVGKNEH